MLKKQNQPIPAKYKKCARVPVIMQMESTECGAAALAMVLAYYGKWVPLEQVRYDCGVSRDGSNMKNILEAAERYGLKAQGYGLDPEKLKSFGYFPCIVQMGFSHFVVVDGFTKRGVLINDPAGGRKIISEDEFDDRFTGATLLLRPSEDFKPEGRPASVALFIRKRMSRAMPVFVLTLIIMAVLGLVSYINPVFSTVFIDEILSGNNPDWIYTLVLIMILVAAVTIALQYLSEGALKKMEGKLAVSGSSEFFWHILHLPMEFFAQRTNDDLILRQNSYSNITYSLVQLLAPQVTNIILMVVYIPILFNVNPWLALIGVGAILINVILGKVTAAARVNNMSIQQRELGRKSSMASSGIRMLSVIKASGAENGYFRGWADFQAAENAVEVRTARVDAYLGLLPTFVTDITNAVVLGVGVYLTFKGNFTVGLLLAFQGFLAQLNSPVNELLSSSQQLQEMKVNMERVDDVFNYNKGNAGVEPSSKPLEGNEEKLHRVEMKDVSFGYSRLGAPVLKNLSFTLEPGKWVALVGGSGSGKSTAGKLLAGLYAPWSGEVLFDGKPIRDIPKSVFGGSVAVVDQDITLFADTIGANIRLWDESIEDFEVILAARDAAIHKEIMSFEDGYNHKLSEGGLNISGGQRQRIEIARALAMNPSILILDEATSALDAQTEIEVLDAVRNHGMACLVIAHRLSTIKDCDEIIVLDHGSVAERGTHAELFAADGIYTRLVSNE